MVKNKLTGNSKLPKVTTGNSYPVDSYKPSKEQQARDRRYAAEDGLRSITRAEEIKSNPKLMRDIKALASEQAQTLKKVCKS